MLPFSYELPRECVCYLHAFLHNCAQLARDYAQPARALALCRRGGGGLDEDVRATCSAKATWDSGKNRVSNRDNNNICG